MNVNVKRMNLEVRMDRLVKRDPVTNKNIINKIKRELRNM